MKKIIFISIISLLNISFVYSGQKCFGDAIVSRVIRVYDGDTITVDIDEFPAIIGKSVGIRIAGIDTPEIRSKSPRLKERAIAAREYLKERLAIAKTIILKKIRRGKYFRIVANVFIDNENIGDELITLGLARKYDGKSKKPWVDQPESKKIHT